MSILQLFYKVVSIRRRKTKKLPKIVTWDFLLHRYDADIVATLKDAVNEANIERGLMRALGVLIPKEWHILFPGRQWQTFIRNLQDAQNKVGLLAVEKFGLTDVANASDREKWLNPLLTSIHHFFNTINTSDFNKAIEEMQQRESALSESRALKKTNQKPLQTSTTPIKTDVSSSVLSNNKNSHTVDSPTPTRPDIIKKVDVDPAIYNYITSEYLKQRYPSELLRQQLEPIAKTRAFFSEGLPRLIEKIFEQEWNFLTTHLNVPTRSQLLRNYAHEMDIKGLVGRSASATYGMDLAILADKKEETAVAILKAVHALLDGRFSDIQMKSKIGSDRFPNSMQAFNVDHGVVAFSEGSIYTSVSQPVPDAIPLPIPTTEPVKKENPSTSAAPTAFSVAPVDTPEKDNSSSSVLKLAIEDIPKINYEQIDLETLKTRFLPKVYTRLVDTLSSDKPMAITTLIRSMLKAEWTLLFKEVELPVHTIKVPSALIDSILESASSIFDYREDLPSLEKLTLLYKAVLLHIEDLLDYEKKIKKWGGHRRALEVGEIPDILPPDKTTVVSNIEETIKNKPAAEQREIIIKAMLDKLTQIETSGSWGEIFEYDPSFKLRDYQIKKIRLLIETQLQFDPVGQRFSVMDITATGGGKTAIAATVAKLGYLVGNPILFAAPFNLIVEGEDGVMPMFLKVFKKDEVSLNNANTKQLAPVTLTTFNMLKNEKFISRYMEYVKMYYPGRQPDFHIDEKDMLQTDLSLLFYQKLRQLFMISPPTYGYSATEVIAGRDVNSIALISDRMTLIDLIKLGYAKHVLAFYVKLNFTLFSRHLGLKMDGKEISYNKLSSGEKTKLNQEIVDVYFKYSVKDNVPENAVFALRDIRQANEVAKLLNEQAKERGLEFMAEPISYKTKDEKEMISRYITQETQALVGVKKLGRGFSEKGVTENVFVMATESDTWLAQVLGRGVRLHELYSYAKIFYLIPSKIKTKFKMARLETVLPEGVINDNPIDVKFKDIQAMIDYVLKMKLEGKKIAGTVGLKPPSIKGKKGDPEITFADRDEVDRIVSEAERVLDTEAQLERRRVLSQDWSKIYELFAKRKGFNLYKVRTSRPLEPVTYDYELEGDSKNMDWLWRTFIRNTFEMLIEEYEIDATGSTDMTALRITKIWGYTGNKPTAEVIRQIIADQEPNDRKGNSYNFKAAQAKINVIKAFLIDYMIKSLTRKKELPDAENTQDLVVKLINRLNSENPKQSYPLRFDYRGEPIEMSWGVLLRFAMATFGNVSVETARKRIKVAVMIVKEWILHPEFKPPNESEITQVFETYDREVKREQFFEQAYPILVTEFAKNLGESRVLNGELRINDSIEYMDIQFSARRIFSYVYHQVTGLPHKEAEQWGPALSKLVGELHSKQGKPSRSNLEHFKELQEEQKNAGDVAKQAREDLTLAKAESSRLAVKIEAEAKRTQAMLMSLPTTLNPAITTFLDQHNLAPDDLLHPKDKLLSFPINVNGNSYELKQFLEVLNKHYMGKPGKQVDNDDIRTGLIYLRNLIDEGHSVSKDFYLELRQNIYGYPGTKLISLYFYKMAPLFKKRINNRLIKSNKSSLLIKEKSWHQLSSTDFSREVISWQHNHIYTRMNGDSFLRNILMHILNLGAEAKECTYLKVALLTMQKWVRDNRPPPETWVRAAVEQKHEFDPAFLTMQYFDQISDYFSAKVEGGLDHLWQSNPSLSETMDVEHRSVFLTITWRTFLNYLLANLLEVKLSDKQAMQYDIALAILKKWKRDGQKPDKLWVEARIGKKEEFTPKAFLKRDLERILNLFNEVIDGGIPSITDSHPSLDLAISVTHDEESIRLTWKDTVDSFIHMSNEKKGKKTYKNRSQMLPLIKTAFAHLAAPGESKHTESISTFLLDDLNEKSKAEVIDFYGGAKKFKTSIDRSMQNMVLGHASFTITDFEILESEGLVIAEFSPKKIAGPLKHFIKSGFYPQKFQEAWDTFAKVNDITNIELNFPEEVTPSDDKK
jgi:superfamily II DNA or RNA helicase